MLHVNSIKILTALGLELWGNDVQSSNARGSESEQQGEEATIRQFEEDFEQGYQIETLEWQDIQGEQPDCGRQFASVPAYLHELSPKENVSTPRQTS